MEEYKNLIRVMGVATDDEVTLVCNINGHTIETLDKILYNRTGYRNKEQYLEALKNS